VPTKLLQVLDLLFDDSALLDGQITDCDQKSAVFALLLRDHPLPIYQTMSRTSLILRHPLKKPNLRLVAQESLPVADYAIQFASYLLPAC
jgi:hypothetical protein